MDRFSLDYLYHDYFHDVECKQNEYVSVLDLLWYMFQPDYFKIKEYFGIELDQIIDARLCPKVKHIHSSLINTYLVCLMCS